MSNPIKFSTGSESDALKKGNMFIGTGAVGKGPSDSTGYYQGPAVPSGGYVIYMNKVGAPGGLSYHSVTNDAELIAFTNSLAGQTFTTAQQCFNYYYGQTDKVLVNQDYPPTFPYIVMDGLVLYLDAGITQSYPGSGTAWSDINGLGPKNNGTLINGPTFNSANGGGIVFDGVDDYAESTSNIGITGNNPRTFECWAFINQSANKNVMGGGTESSGALFDTIIWPSNGYLRVIGHYYGGGFDTLSTLPPRNTINLNQWNHIAHLYDGSTASLYTNGLFSNSLSLSLNTGNNKVKMGAGYYGVYNFFDGRGGTFRIYNRALTASEVLQNYNAQKGRFGL